MRFFIVLHTHAHILNGFEEHFEILLGGTIYFFVFLAAGLETAPINLSVVIANINAFRLPENIAEIQRLSIHLAAFRIYYRNEE